ncbi:DUF6838 family protein [Bacillus sp. FJAT-22090]|uniref:phage tail terminator family protein n=1 Tax=Bacillus sp. FJAT-22090 TaxID=1581038 RepID=UPI0011A4A5FE|nr:hypothetical protein [Bacillus sp. FJAT-22090]
MEINDVITAISIKLYETFGESYEIYTESIEQGFKEPAFFIALLNPSFAQVVGSRYHETLPFDIHYFGRGNMDTYSTADKLMAEMEYIKLLNGDLLRGTKMKGEVVDGVLHFFVNYNFHVYKVKDPLDKMEDLKIKNGLKV